MINVTPHKDGWNVGKAVYKTQKEAIDAGRKIAIANKDELVIHGRDGKIREKNSYGHDPRKTRG